MINFILDHAAIIIPFLNTIIDVHMVVFGVFLSLLMMEITILSILIQKRLLQLSIQMEISLWRNT